MDGLDDFEKALAAEKADRERAREKEERHDRKHAHHRHHRRRHHRDQSPDRDQHRDQDGHKNKTGHHRSRRESHSDEENKEDDHRHKRSRLLREDESEGEGASKHRRRDKPRRRSRDRSGNGNRHRLDDNHTKSPQASDPNQDLPLPDEEKALGDRVRPPTPLTRDAWMTDPSALDIDYVHRGEKKTKAPWREEPKRLLHKRELNREVVDGTTHGEIARDRPADSTAEEAVPHHQVKYMFGDEGSQWRMAKLEAVYTTAEETGRPVDAVAMERLGSLEEFDEAREEKTEMDRRRLYGEGYVGKEKPTGELYRERMSLKAGHGEESPPPDQGVLIDSQPLPAAPPPDQTTLNRMRGQLMRAQLRKAPEAAKLQADYDAAVAAFNNPQAHPSRQGDAVVLDASASRRLAGGPRNEIRAVTSTRRARERGHVEANDDMTVDDMVREERRTRNQAGGDGLKMAERIARDQRYDNHLEYLDENAEKLARRVERNEAGLKSAAVSEYKRLSKMLDACPLCHHEDRDPPADAPIAPIVARGTRVYLTLAPRPEIGGAEGGAVVVPMAHHSSLLECDEDEWEEVRNFMKSLTRLYHDQGRDVLFYENAAASQNRRPHAAMVAVPVPYEFGATAPAFFREAMLSQGEEWSQHPKVIDTLKRSREASYGRMAFRKSLAKEMPYFHVWFGLDGGLAHVVDDPERWPRGDIFAREVIGGMVDCDDPSVVKQRTRWEREAREDERMDGFKRGWRKFDWTRVLVDGGSW